MYSLSINCDGNYEVQACLWSKLLRLSKAGLVIVMCDGFLEYGLLDTLGALPAESSPS